MHINYSGKVARRRYLDALLLNNQQNRPAKWFFGILLVFFILSIPFLISIKTTADPEVWEPIGQFLFPTGLIPLVFLTFPWWIPYVQAMSYGQKGNIYRDTVSGLIDDTGVSIKTPNLQAHFEWSAFINYRLSRDTLLLYQGKYSLLIFTKEMFDNLDSWEKATVFSKEKVTENKKRA